MSDGAPASAPASSGRTSQKITCRHCGATVVRSNRDQVTCGSPKCKAKHKAEYKREWKREHQRKRSPEQLQKARDRNRRWCEENRGCRTRNPWLLGEPCFGRFLPGGACMLSIDVVTRSGSSRLPRIPTNKLSTLHGMISALLDEGHGQEPGFSLIPYPGGIGWAVYAPTPALGANPRARPAVLGPAKVLVHLGPYGRLHAPPNGKRGRRRVKVSTLTPVVVRSDGRTGTYVRTPTAEVLRNTLRQTLARRLGLDVAEEDLPVELVDARTEPVELDVGGHVGGHGGFVKGWMGSVTVETNAIGRWLLECAGRGLGLGGRTAFGCGRVRVEVVS